MTKKTRKPEEPDPETELVCTLDIGGDVPVLACAAPKSVLRSIAGRIGTEGVRVVPAKVEAEE